MRQTLPEKYYLHHALELFNNIERSSDHLLNQEQRDLLKKFKLLEDDCQALLIRFLTRKSVFLDQEKLSYAEIKDIPLTIDKLIQQGILNCVRPDQWQNFVPNLTKKDLLLCIKAKSPNIKSGISKLELVRLVSASLSGQEACILPIRKRFLTVTQRSDFDYILFLYFGSIGSRLQKFVMRDLGVLKTRPPQKIQDARFDSIEQAQNAFDLYLLRRQFKSQVNIELLQAAKTLVATPPASAMAQGIWDSLVFDVGKNLIGTSAEKALSLLQRSSHPKAVELWVRQKYRIDPSGFKNHLARMKEGNHPPQTTLFLNDFYARKYQGKRTSIYTDLLRESHHKTELDECYLGNVERGVIEQYARRGISAYFSENILWKSLFALTFWELLYHSPSVAHNEFDRLPPILTTGDFYLSHKLEIERSLKRFSQPEALLTHFTKLAAQNYGRPTGLFRWHTEVLRPIQSCLRHSPGDAIARVLRSMAQDFKHKSDGYPDIMVEANGALFFEEIKAPGDTLKPNQVVSIARLRKAGFEVRLNQVSWATDPKQRYAVVDIETTGMRNGGAHAITEIAVVIVQNSEIVDQWSSLLNPKRMIPFNITQLTGISNSMVEDAPVFAEIADHLATLLSDSIFVAHNVNFDFGFIREAFAQLNRPFNPVKYCTVKNSRKAFPRLKSYSLGNLANYFDLDLKHAHRALDDALATAELLMLIQQQNKQQIRQTSESDAHELG